MKYIVSESNDSTYKKGDVIFVDGMIDPVLGDRKNYEVDIVFNRGTGNIKCKKHSLAISHMIGLGSLILVAVTALIILITR